MTILIVKLSNDFSPLFPTEVSNWTREAQGLQDTTPINNVTLREPHINQKPMIKDWFFYFLASVFYLLKG